MAPTVTLWFGLGAILMIHGLVRRRLVTGQTVLTGVWWLSATALLLNPASATYVTPEATALILSVHALFGVGSVVVAGFRGPSANAQPPFPRGVLFPRGVAAMLFWPVTLAGVLGGVLCALHTGALTAAWTGELAQVRANVTAGITTIPVLYRLLGNASYPAVTLGSIAYLATPRRGLLYLGLPLAALALYSLAQGGRGALLVGAFVVLWSFAIGLDRRGLERPVRRRIRRTALGLLSLLVAYSAYVVTTRSDAGTPISSLYRYFTDPIPAFSEWLRSEAKVDLLSANLSNLAIVREGKAIAGVRALRAVDQDIVFVPEPFNVFTGLAEEFDTAGTVGTMLLFIMLGGAASWTERAGMSAGTTAWRIVLYTYLAYTIFADLACYIVGFWLMVGTAGVLTLAQPVARVTPGGRRHPTDDEAADASRAAQRARRTSRPVPGR
jgi:oligosaccharide repeat unit polymerase